MAAFSDYNTLLTDELGSNETVFNNTSVRLRVINEALRWVADNYDVPELLYQQDLVFASGKVAIPARFLRMEKLYDADTLQEYVKYRPNEFDNAGTGWTIDYDVTSAARVIMVKPTTVTTLRARQFRKPYTFTSDADVTDDGMPTEIGRPAMQYAAFLLFSRRGEADRAGEKLTMAEKLLSLWANTFSDDPGYIQSAYEGTAYLNTSPVINDDI